jgi:RecA-family ATPase
VADLADIDVTASPIPALERIATRLIDPVSEGPPDIIPGFLPRQGQLVIAGATNVGKSLAALEVCSSLSTGRPLWGELEPSMQARKILYILGEHYNEVIQRLWQHTKLPMTDQVFLLGPEQLGYDKWLVAQGRPNPTAIAKLSKWAEGVDLIVFDPLSAFVTGVDTENDNIQMRLVLDSMSLIAKVSGASCIVLAHQGKPSIDKDGNERARTSYAVRGASAIEDAATNIFYMSPAAGEKGEKGSAQIYSMIQRKYKGLAPPEYRLLRDNATLTHSLLGNRPFVEVQKIAAQAEVSRIQQAMPNMSFADAIAAVAAVRGVDERTVRRYLS